MRTGEWARYGDLLETDAEFRRTGVPVVRGREAIVAMLLEETASLPGSLIERTETVWCAFDPVHLRGVQEMRHVARDPGNGSRHYALADETLSLGPRGLWQQVTLTHSPYAYRRMYRSWSRAAARCGQGTAAQQVDAVAWLARPVV